MGAKVVDLVSSEEEEEEEEEEVEVETRRPQPAPTAKRRRSLVASSSSSEESEEEDDEEDEAVSNTTVESDDDEAEFEEVFEDLDDEEDEEEEEVGIVPPPTIDLQDDDDSAEEAYQHSRQTVLQDLKLLDDKERGLREDMARLETAIAVVHGERDAKKRELAQLSSAHNKSSLAQDRTWSSESFKHSARLRQELKRVFGFDEFRELQLQALNATLVGRDCFVVLPTGSGKSLLFQLAAVVQEGVTVVVSPLLSLSRDQIYNLSQRGIPALMICSGLSAEETRTAYTRLRGDNAVRLVYVTPEMLVKSKKLVAALEQLHRRRVLRRICIDEAHCCSTMGHDFRPDYQKLHVLRRQFPGVPILCVTATATVRVEEDVRATLQLAEDWVCFRASFNRANLRYEVRDKPVEHAKQVYQLLDIIHQHKNQTGIIYCMSRKDTERIAHDLCAADVAARCYHSKVPAKEQAQVHALWRQGKVKVVVATTSFGMGIDMPTVRFVVHACLSTSTEGYVQESGRAGRDGKPAVCVLLYRRADVLRVSSLVSDKKNGLDKLREMIDYCENVLECRRIVTGRCFGEQFDAAKCHGQCDVCANTNASAAAAYKVDHTVPAESLVRRLARLRQDAPLVTMPQLVDAWRTKAGQQQHLHQQLASPGDWTATDCERLVMQLILRDVLRVGWGYTAYGTNAYLEPGDRARLLCAQQLTIEYGVREEDAVAGKQRRSAATSGATGAAASAPFVPLFQSASSFSKSSSAAAAAVTPKPAHASSSSSASAPTIKSMFSAFNGSGDSSHTPRNAGAASTLHQQQPQYMCDSIQEEDFPDHFSHQYSSSSVSSAKKTSSSSASTSAARRKTSSATKPTAAFTPPPPPPLFAPASSILLPPRTATTTAIITPLPDFPSSQQQQQRHVEGGGGPLPAVLSAAAKLPQSYYKHQPAGGGGGDFDFNSSIDYNYQSDDHLYND